METMSLACLQMQLSDWRFRALCSSSREEDGQWKEDQKLEAHSDWVRDVGWAPSIGLPTSTIASCSQVIHTHTHTHTRYTHTAYYTTSVSWSLISLSSFFPLFTHPVLLHPSPPHPQDGRVFIWTCDDPSGNTWTAKLLHKFNDVVWHVSWSITGNILAVSGGDNKVVCVCVYLHVCVCVCVRPCVGQHVCAYCGCVCFHDSMCVK